LAFGWRDKRSADLEQHQSSCSVMGIAEAARSLRTASVEVLGQALGQRTSVPAAHADE